MDKLHREHDFVQNMWKFMKACEQQPDKNEEFWTWAHESAEKLSRDYDNLSFTNDWIVSFLKFLDQEAAS